MAEIGLHLAVRQVENLNVIITLSQSEIWYLSSLISTSVVQEHAP